MAALAGRYGPTRRPSARRLRKRAQAERHRAEAERRQRLATLAADPVRRRYVVLIEAGEWWTDEQIAYDLDPGRTVTCSHLAPIEHAMRVAGVRVRRAIGPWTTADCRVDLPTLAQAMPVPREVYYSNDMYAGGRYAEDPPSSALLCNVCRSGITVVAPNETKPETRWFPHAPA